jgi:hypothetical protein
METRKLAEMAGGILVAALRSEHYAAVSGETGELFARWHISVPDDLILQTRRPAGTPDEERALAGRWQRLCAGLLSAHPEAERELFAMISRLRRLGLALPPPSPPGGSGGGGDDAGDAKGDGGGGGGAGDGRPAYRVPGYGPGQPLYAPQPSRAPQLHGYPPPAAPVGAPSPASPAPGAPAPGGRPGQSKGGRSKGGRSKGGRPLPSPPARGGRGGPRTAARERAQPLAAGIDDTVVLAVRSAVRPGVLAFNPPGEMTQGRPERVEVGVARSAELVDSLVSGLRGRGEVRIEQVPTSAFMSAELRGDSFAITALSPAEQIVAPAARWEFDVTPRHAGVQTLTLCVSLRFAETGPLAVPGSRIAVPVVERKIRIRVSVGYGARAFVTQNWQWLVGTAVAIGGAVAAFLAVVH